MSTIILKFPRPVLTKLPADEAPTAISCKKLLNELYENAASISSSLGGGENGHLGMAQTVAEYSLEPRPIGVPFIAFIMPVNPGTLQIAGGAGPVAIQNAKSAHIHDTKVYETAVAVADALRAMIIETVDETFIAACRNPRHGYGKVTPLTLITHLDTTYGQADDDDLNTNMETFEAPWDPSTPIEPVFTRFDECRQFADDAGDPISVRNTIRNAIKIFEKSGALEDGLKTWRNRPAIEHNLVNLRLHFIKANKLRNCNQTSKDAGYANKVTETKGTANKENDPPKLDREHHAYTGQRMFYCHTHGLNFKCSGKFCKAPGPKHNKWATFNNMRGGCSTIERRPGENAVG